MPIPIRNIYFMFCYAWGQFTTGSKIAVGVEDSPDLQDLLAKALIHGVRHLLRRGLDRQYVDNSEDTLSPRGRIEFGQTMKRSLRRRGQLHCSFDELSPDVLHNRIIKTSVGRLSKSRGLDRTLRYELGLLYRQLEGISEIRIGQESFKRVELNRNSAYYRFLIHICELVHAQLLPDERGSGFSFLEVLEDEVRMSNVFEEFIRNFFRIEQNYFRPGKRRIAWDIDWISEEANAVLPVMENDVRLDAPDETIVIDAKYYKSALKAPRGRASYQGRERLISANLYQIYSYLKNLAPTIEDGRLLRGILVYPAAARSVDVEMVVQGHHIRVFTVNLDQEWRGIHSDLLSLLETPRTAVVHPR